MRENIKKYQTASATPSAKSEKAETTPVADIEDIRLILHSHATDNTSKQREAAATVNENLEPQPRIQAKLTVGEPDDKYEEEADRIADRVMRSSQPLSERTPQQERTSEAIPSALESRIRDTQQSGQPLPDETRGFMESRLDTDLSAVKVHTDTEANTLADALDARAFTVGENIWFGRGEGPADRSLLAHELTHTIQQKKSWQMPLPAGVHMTSEATRIQREVSTPLDDYVKKVDKKKSAKFKVGDVSVEVKHDKKSKDIVETGGETKFNIDWGFAKKDGNPVYPGYNYDKDGKITKFQGPLPKTPKVTIQTLYGTKASPKSQSAYGRGTTKADKKAGNTSLRFHEGSHGEDYLRYLKDNPPPTFQGKVGMKKDDYIKAQKAFNKQIQDYEKAMEDYSKKRTDCVGDEAGFCAE